jgi:hypothetical protein
MLDCEAPFDAVDVKRVVEAIAKDETLMEELRYWMSTLQIASIISDDSIAGAQRASALITAELGREGTP